MTGRPQNAVETVPIKLRIPKPLVGYMTVLAKDFGWGATATDVAGFLLVRELARLQEARFHDQRLPYAESGDELEG